MTPVEGFARNQPVLRSVAIYGSARKANVAAPVRGFRAEY